MTKLPPARDRRKADHPVQNFILDRWSPRAMSGEPVTDAELMSLFEAARWAPSSSNEQPWRFLYAKRGTPQWAAHFNTLVEFNQGWCKDAGALILVISRKTFVKHGKPNQCHGFDTGSAFENLMLQGCSMGLVMHGMAGLDYDKARRDLGVPDDHNIEAMVAVGRPGDPTNLPEALRDREIPSGRNPVTQFVREGKFAF